MNHEQMIQELMNYVKSTEAFITEQAPLVVKEMLRYGWIDAMMSLCVCATVVLICAIVMLFFSATNINYIDMPIKVVAGYILFVFFMMGCSQVSTLVKIKTAPRLYVIEQIKNK